MNNSIDVKRISDIPDIEKYLNECFYLDMYDKGDNTQFYELVLDNSDIITINIISDENLIENSIPLISIISQYNIYFLEFTYESSLLSTSNVSYRYRPLINGYCKEPWDKLINNGS